MSIHTSCHDKSNFMPQKYLQVNSCGKEIHYYQAYHVVRKNGRLDYLILYILTGTCTVEYQGTRSELSAGDFVHYLPYDKQEYFFNADQDCSAFYLHYTGNDMSSILKELQFKGGVYHFPVSEKIITTFKEIVSEYQLCPPLHEQAKSALLLSLLTQIARQINYGHLRSSQINDVICLMKSRYDQKYDVLEYANYCTLSPDRFSHKFKEATGSSPLQYFINLKLEKAKELLSYSDLSITEVAEKIGYDNPLYFSRQFKAHMGYSPNKYRKTLHLQRES